MDIHCKGCLRFMKRSCSQFHCLDREKIPSCEEQPHDRIFGYDETAMFVFLIKRVTRAKNILAYCEKLLTDVTLQFPLCGDSNLANVL